MKVRTLEGVKHIVLDVDMDDPKELVRGIKDKLDGNYYERRYYPFNAGNFYIYVWFNTQGFLHFIINSTHYRVNKAREIVFVGSFVSDLDKRYFVNSVREDYKFLVEKGIFDEACEI